MSVPASMCKLAATWRTPWYAQELLIFVIFIYFIVKLLTRMFLRNNMEPTLFDDQSTLKYELDLHWTLPPSLLTSKLYQISPLRLIQ